MSARRRPRPQAPTPAPLFCRSFLDHINGANHAKKNGGSRTFAGLVPNKAGFIPEILDPALAAAVAAFDRGDEVPEVPSPQSQRAQQSRAKGGGIDLEFPDEDEDDEDAWVPPAAWAPPPRDINTTPEAVAEARSSLNKMEAIIAESAPQVPKKEEEEEAAVGADGEEEASPRLRQDAPRRVRRPRPIPPLPEPLVDGGPMAATRQQLPVYQYREQLLEALRSEVRERVAECSSVSFRFLFGVSRCTQKQKDAGRGRRRWAAGNEGRAQKLPRREATTGRDV